jgi:hypothetical protein
MSTVLTPPRPPVAKGNGNGGHAASKPNGNGSGAATVGYTKQDAEQLRGMILAAVAKGEMTVEAAAKELAELVEVRSVGPLRCKVSDKGAVSVYGLQSRWPVTLYADQWERLFAVAEDIRAFIGQNNGQLSRKQR